MLKLDLSTQSPEQQFLVQFALDYYQHDPAKLAEAFAALDESMREHIAYAATHVRAMIACHRQAHPKHTPVSRS